MDTGFYAPYHAVAGPTVSTYRYGTYEASYLHDHFFKSVIFSYAPSSYSFPSLCFLSVKTFGDPDSPYQAALAKRADKVYPVPGPWIQGGLITALKNIKAGLEPPGAADAEDNDGFTTSLPAVLVAPDQGPAVAKLVTTGATALDHLTLQTLILNNYLEGGEEPIRRGGESVAAELPELALEVSEVLAAVEDNSNKSVSELVERFGKACPLPGSFKSSLVVLLRCEKDYVGAVRQNILAGGDCNARANFIGACLGARLGIEGIPMEWIEKVKLKNFLTKKVVQ